MNANEKTRLVCRIARLRDSVFGSRAGGHAASCPDCQAYVRAEHALVNSLRATAPHGADPASSALAERIARSVRETPPSRERSRVPGAWVAVAGSLAVFAISFYLVRPRVPARGGEKKPEVVASVDMREIVVDVDALRSRLLTNVGPSAQKLAKNNPLAQDLVLVQTDARSALNFLAMNFIPTEGAGSARDPGPAQPRW